MGVKRVDNIPLYMCTECGILYGDRLQAELCHKKYFCEDCGAEAPKYHFYCDDCSKKREYERATKMTYDEYIQKYPGNMIVYGDTYYMELEDLLDELEEEEIEDYIYGTEKERIEIDADCILSDLEDNADVEDFYIDDVGKEELYNFVEQWNKKYGQEVYYINKDIIILLPDKE